MAQELFMTDERMEQREREKLIERGMIIWRECAEDYRTLIIKYLFLIEEKRKKKLPPKRVPKAALEDYPIIPFLRILEEDEAKFVLESMSTYELRMAVEDIDFTLASDYSFRTIKGWVTDTIYALTHEKPRAFSLAR